MKATVIALMLCLSANLWAQDEEAVEQVTAMSCSLFVKTQVRPVALTEPDGQVQVEATLCDRNGVPIADQELHLTSSSGTFACLPSDSVLPPGDSLAGPCFVTKGNGTITVFLNHVPFNKPGRVTATCTYKTFKLKSIGTYLITRKTIKSAKKVRKS